MVKLISLAAFALLISAPFTSKAQSSIAEATNYVLPQTAIKVKITVACENIKIGPYARFSQQYLGVTAPLNDKTTYSIVSTKLDSYDEASLSDIYLLDHPATIPAERLNKGGKRAKNGGIAANERGVNSDILFPDLGITPIVYSATSSLEGRTSAREKSLEEMASDAATTIFTLRKRRFDLITGELGEAVYGEGMKAALEEMARIEDEYLSLFVGKRSLTYKTYSYDVTPQKDKTSYILSRFSAMGGMVEPADMSGEPVVLTITAEGVVKPAPIEGKSSSKGNSTKYRVADMAICKLFFSTELLDNERIPILQYGIVVEK